MRRRTLLAGAGAAAGVAALGGWYQRRGSAVPVIPDTPLGDERLEQRRSAARGRTVDFYTAVPAGHGDGRGLPVLLVLHGGSKTAADFVRAVAAFSPAVSFGDDVFTRAAALRGMPVGLWCGIDDGLLNDVRALERALPHPRAAGSYTPGRHNFGYWSTCLPAACDLVARSLR